MAQSPLNVGCPVKSKTPAEWSFLSGASQQLLSSPSLAKWTTKPALNQTLKNSFHLLKIFLKKVYMKMKSNTTDQEYGLVSSLNGISNFMGYLMPRLSS